MPSTPKQETGISRNQIVIDQNNFLAGMSSSPYAQDGGFSNESINVNLLANVGILSGTPLSSTVDISHSPTSNMIASCDNTAASESEIKYFSDDMGYYYSLTGSTLTRLGQDTHSGSTYTAGQASILQYLGSTYFTNAWGVAQASGHNLSTFTNNFQQWTSTNANLVPHPMLLFNGYILFADGNKIAQYDGSSYTTALLTLAANESIVAMSLDPSSGRILLAVNEYAAGQNSSHTQSYLALYDGASPSTLVKRVPIEEQVTSFLQVGATVFVFYGQNMGYFNGSGITFLRRLANNVFGNNTLPYPAHVCSIGSTIFVIENNNVLAYGPVSGSKNPVFYYVLQEGSVNSSGITLICNLGANMLCTAFEDISSIFHLNSSNLTATSSNNGLDFRSLSMGFPRPIFVRRIDIECQNSVAANTIVGILYSYDQDGNSKEVVITNTAAVAKYRFEVNWDNIRVHRFQMRFVSDGFNNPVVRFIIRYDVAE